MPPWLTLLGSILVLILAFGFIFFVARGCVATQESTQVRKYVTNADSILSESSNAGNEKLQTILQNAGGDPAQLKEEEMKGAADQASLLYQRALGNDEVPPEFEDAHHYLVSALGIRAGATEQLERAVSGDAGSFGEALSTAVEDYRLSDSIVRNHYLPAAQEALEEAGQRSDQSYLEEPAPFMDYQELGFDASVPAAEDAAQDDPNALHGVEITSVEIAGQSLFSGGTVTLSGSDELVFTVTVTNGGETPETGVPVEIILNTKAERQEQTATIERIEPSGGFATVDIKGFRVGELNETAEVTVKAGPVKYEQFMENNTLAGTVTFGL